MLSNNVVINDDGDKCDIFLNGFEIKDVTRYEVGRSVGNIVELTFTIYAETVSVNKAPVLNDPYDKKLKSLMEWLVIQQKSAEDGSMMSIAESCWTSQALKEVISKIKVLCD